MVLKINNRPVLVEEEEEKKEFSWVYLTVSSIGYLLIFYVIDYAAAIFCGVHPFKWIEWVGNVIHFIGRFI